MTLWWRHRTMVCRSLACTGGGWWGIFVPEVCPYCGAPLVELAPVAVTSLHEQPPGWAARSSRADA